VENIIINSNKLNECIKTEAMPIKIDLPKGVIFNAYPDSIGHKLSDITRMLQMSEFKDVFSLFYILPTIFNSDLDRGFSIIDYDLNDELVSREDLDQLHELNVMFKFDLVLNHLSVGSPQFQDLLKNGDESKYKDFFIDWNKFWCSHGEMGSDGYIIPYEEYLEKLFTRKPGLPILNVRFPDGTDRPYWNTFYQEVTYCEITAHKLLEALAIKELTHEDAENIAAIVNDVLNAKQDIHEIDLSGFCHLKDDVVSVVKQNRKYLGQMDLNAQSQEVWDFYDETLKKLRDHGGKLVRLDAFAYLAKEPGKSNFFNEPGTWDYLEKLRRMANKYDLILLPEIHSEYGEKLHQKVAAKGFPIYDFFFPGLVIHALDRGTNKHLLHWITELKEKNIKTINMLGCHDGIPILDLNGKNNSEISEEGLISGEEIDAVIERVLDRGGRVKNLYGPDGKKISYYQVNATFFSALGEDEQKLRLARAIQVFMPGLPQVWYLDLFAGKNDYAAADKGGTGGHKEINRTTLTNSDIEKGLKQPVVRDQLEIMRLRNTSPAFDGELIITRTDEHSLHLTWKHQESVATLKADLQDYSFSISHQENSSDEKVMSFC
jgi:sucrose phosphorylase